MDLRVIFILAALGIVQCKLIQSCKQTKSFVDGHNARRLKLAQGSVPGQPAASEMNKIIWDEELATKASKWAARNNYIHNPDRTIRSGRFPTGENLFRFRTSDMNASDFNPEEAMKYWWAEHKEYDYGALTEGIDGSGETGHYTQMAWSDSVRIGCAVSQYIKDGWNNFLAVCNYGPTGNYVGQKPYKSDYGGSGHLNCGESDCSQMYGDHC